MNEETSSSTRLRRALIHDLRGLLSPIYTISQGRTLFELPNPEEAAEEYLMFLQATAQMNELLNSWDLAFSKKEEKDTPRPVDALAIFSSAANLVREIIPKESCPQIALPIELPSCIGLENLLRQASADTFRFLAGLGSTKSTISVAGTVSGDQANYTISISGVSCSKDEISDYLHQSKQPNRYVYALLGARIMLEKQKGRLEFTSSENTGTLIQLTLPC